MNPVSVVDEWCKCASDAGGVLGAPCGCVPEGAGRHFLGGWWLSRSAVVMWGNADGLYFYRCGDEQEHQLAWAVPDGFEFDRAAYHQASRVYAYHLETYYTHAYRHVVACEQLLACKGLERLLLGADVHEAIADLPRLCDI